jgi:hypothetical protein
MLFLDAITGWVRLTRSDKRLLVRTVLFDTRSFSNFTRGPSYFVPIGVCVLMESVVLVITVIVVEGYVSTMQCPQR